MEKTSKIGIFALFTDLSSIEHDLGLPPSDPYVLHNIVRFYFSLLYLMDHKLWYFFIFEIFNPSTDHGGVLEGLSKLLKSVQERIFQLKHLTKFQENDNKTDSNAEKVDSNNSGEIKEHHAEKHENTDLSHGMKIEFGILCEFSSFEDCVPITYRL